MKAFPVSFIWENEYKDFNGMDLRDYFAAKAMQEQINNPLSIGGDEAYRVIAERAYRMADAMMEVRKQNG
jgi:hypothetical protein